MCVLGKEVFGVIVNCYCVFGLEIIFIVVVKICVGMGEIYVVGGIESMSFILMMGYKFVFSYKVVFFMFNYLVSMGLMAEAVVNKYNISWD